MQHAAPSREQVLDAVRGSDKQKVKVAVTDIDGVLRGKYIHRDKFFSAADSGFGFCNVVFGWDAGDVCYDNSRYTGWHTGYPDADVKLDLSTYRTIPWEGNVSFLLGEFVDADGRPLSVCPRQLLKRVVGRAHEMGYSEMFGMEFEWFNFKETPQSLREKGFRSLEPMTPGMFGYSIIRAGQNQPFFAAMMDELATFGVPLEGLHTETGPGVLEAAILVADAVESADRAVLFKSAVKDIGYRFGIMPSFMAKWNAQLPGCSGHIHQSLWSADKHTNVFYDEAAPHKMSATFRHYIAGQMHCLPHVLPMFAPTVNSFKRLVEGAWAPTKVNWGIDNRTVALRAIPGSKKSTRLETRVSGSDVNPYLAVAAALASGLYGIERKLELPSEAHVGNGYRDETAPALPKSLFEAAERMGQSEVAKELFGADFVEHFVATRLWEWRQFQSAVTDWEMARYFEII